MSERCCTCKAAIFGKYHIRLNSTEDTEWYRGYCSYDCFTKDMFKDADGFQEYENVWRKL